ncbi:MAG TPA: hypothetical protein VK034_22625 [Enhygromyxa sp.]|nr:hypothetical protein [Enhygromyxa sp.]
MLTLLPFVVGCQQYPEIADYGVVCVTAEQSGDQHRLVVDANSSDCASDHEGASFECSISTDGLVAHIETVFQDGKDPNDACAEPLETTCEIEVEPGSYTLEFAGEQYQLEVPGAGRVCIPGGGEGTDD